jgi:Rrf2 family nitric oxide-sensitive transcriptional repressor
LRIHDAEVESPAQKFTRGAGGARPRLTKRGHGRRLKENRGFDLRLSLYTDFSLRLLMYLAAAEPDAWVTTPNVAHAFGISLNHLQKSVQGLVRAGYVEALQGRAGGVRLAQPAAEIRIGGVVAALEGAGCLVDCGRGPCPLSGRCLLKRALDEAERGFIRALDGYSLADVVAHQTGVALQGLIAMPSAR